MEIKTLENTPQLFGGRKTIFLSWMTLLMSTLAACGGGNGGAGASGSGVRSYVVSGTVSGLSGSGLVIQNNSGNNLPINTTGAFSFSTSLPSGANYSVSVLSQPTGPTQTCTVSNGSGTVANSDITNVTLSCVTNSYRVGGTLSGLSSGNSIMLQMNGGDNLTLTADGTFTFPTAIQSGTAYSASILTLPSGQPCTSTYGADVVNSSNVTNINVICGPAFVGAWTPASSMTTTRGYHASILLPNGKILVSGGVNASLVYLSSAELYDATTNAWTATGSMAIARAYHTATLLPNGKVLVVGGVLVAGGTQTELSSAELFDPSSGTWSTTGSMAVVRSFHTATLLSNGKVLVAGGNDGGGYVLSSAELYDPATGTWSSAGNMNSARQDSTATLLPNGKVLLAGRANGSVLSNAELYDPSTGTWTNTGNMASARRMHTATLLPNGKVLVAGGIDGTGAYILPAELYDPSTGTWSTTGSMANARAWYAALLLPTGKVLVAGGMNGGALPLSSAELYDPSNGTWSTTGSMANPRGQFSAATLLNNGKVLVEGSYSSGLLISNAELYW